MTGYVCFNLFSVVELLHSMRDFPALCRSSPKRRDLRKLLKPSRKNQPPLWREPGADKSGLACPRSKCKSGQESLEILTTLHTALVFSGAVSK